MMAREIKKIINGTKTSDGDGVRLTRLIASPELAMLDPFLLMDSFSSDKAQDYIGGFPSHPHRGVETVTYMLAGKMRHKDSLGNSGVIAAGGVQLMSAGKGIIHSEMPEQEEGLLSGLQLWINLPAVHKMDKPHYQEISENNIPEEVRGDSCRIKVIAGQTEFGTQGVIKNDWIQPIYWDILLSQDAQFVERVPRCHNAFIYVIEGELSVGDCQLDEKQLAVLSLGDCITIEAKSDSRFLLVAGKPLDESIVRDEPAIVSTCEKKPGVFGMMNLGN